MFWFKFLVAAVFCSNTKLSATCEINDFRLINNLLTFTLSKALALVCSVFWPNTTTPLPGNVAIGLTFPTYRLSLFVCVNFLSACLTTPNPPLLIPAGANQVSAEASLAAYTPGINVEAGTHANCPVLGSVI